VSQSKPQDGDLFIVDNSAKYWKVHLYLGDWIDLARSVDIATDYFEIGPLLALDGQWQKLKKIRILKGDEVSKRTRPVTEAQKMSRPLKAAGANAALNEESMRTRKERNNGAAARRKPGFKAVMCKETPSLGVRCSPLQNAEEPGRRGSAAPVGSADRRR